MLLVVDKSNYISDERISDFSLEKQVGFDTLEKFAKESDVSVQIRTFNNYSFGKLFNAKLRLLTLNIILNMVL